jgi:hypothetical protein
MERAVDHRRQRRILLIPYPVDVDGPLSVVGAMLAYGGDDDGGVVGDIDAADEELARGDAFLRKGRQLVVPCARC